MPVLTNARYKSQDTICITIGGYGDWTAVAQLGQRGIDIRNDDVRIVALGDLAISV